MITMQMPFTWSKDRTTCVMDRGNGRIYVLTIRPDGRRNMQFMAMPTALPDLRDGEVAGIHEPREGNNVEHDVSAMLAERNHPTV